MSGAATGQSVDWYQSKGTRLRWTGPTNLGPCVQLAGSGAGVTDMMVDSPSNLQGHVIETAFNGIRGVILQRLRVLTNTSSAAYYGVALHDFFQADVQSVAVVGVANGFLLDVPNNRYNVGNSVFSNIVAYLRAHNRIGINCVSRISASGSGRMNLITFNQAQVMGHIRYRVRLHRAAPAWGGGIAVQQPRHREHRDLAGVIPCRKQRIKAKYVHQPVFQRQRLYNQKRGLR